MQAIQEALHRLTDQASCFVRIRRHRVFHVRVAADVRKVALKVVMAMENHGLNQSPWIFVPDATLGAHRGWPARVERLRADHATRHEAFVEAGHDMRELALPEGGDGDSLASLHGPVGAFGAMVRAYRHSLPGFLDGLVVVLAPTRVELSSEWSADLHALIQSPELADVRWVLVDEGEGDPLARDELAGVVREHRCQPDPEQAKQDAVTFLASFDAQRGVGRACPDDYPPERKRERYASPDQSEVNELAPEVGVTEAILTAAARVQQGELARAIEWQTAAVRRAEGVGDPALEARCRLTLAGYLKHARKDRFAAGQYAHAVRIAEEARIAGVEGLEPVEVSARFALGLSWWGEGRSDEALAELGRTADLAERTGRIAVAIAAWRHAGQLARELELVPQCVRAWALAVKLGAAHPEAGKLAQSDEVGRLLLEVCRTHELDAATAAELDALGVELHSLGDDEEEAAE